jgi:hypothetical protein
MPACRYLTGRRYAPLALARYLRHPVTTMLAHEIARIMRGQVYERVVFLIRPIGFIEPSAARRISYADSLAFERLHEVVYRDHGFEIINVAAADVTGRAAAIIESLSCVRCSRQADAKKPAIAAAWRGAAGLQGSLTRAESKHDALRVSPRPGR